jgi:PAS domain S-box-containing protein
MPAKLLTLDWEKTEPLKIISKIFISVSIVIAVLVLIGWQLNVPLLRGGLTGMAATNPVSALLFIMTGVSAWLLSDNQSDKKVYWIGKTLALIIFVIAAIKASSIFGLGDIAIDKILFGRQIMTVDPTNQMAPVSTLNFVLLGLGLFVIDFKGGLFKNPTHLLVLLSLSLVMLSFIGYLYGVIYLYEIASASYYPIPLNSVIIFLLMDAAILLMRPKDGFIKLALSNSDAGIAMRNLISIILWISIMFGWLRFYLQQEAIISNALIVTLTVVFDFFITAIVIWWNTKSLFVSDEKRKDAAIQLKYQYALLQSIISSIGEAILVIDDRCKVLVTNKTTAKLLGKDQNDIVGKDIRKDITFLKNGQEISIKEKFGLSGPLAGNMRVIDLRDDIYLKNKDGKIFPIAGVFSPLKGFANINGCVFSFRDISKDKEIDIAKTEFVSLASHQLRTPLSTISWYAEMLNNGDAGPMQTQQLEYINEIMHANKRMIGLVNALLNVSQIELGVLEVVPKPVNAVKVARIVLQELEVTILEKKLIMEEFYDKDIPVIMADSHYIKIILQNLISNAVKYSPAGGTIKIYISKGNKEIQFRVSDMGLGIPDSARSKIFLKLFRADNIKLVDTSGNGLGLYLVKLIVDKAGGKIWFESEENRGTTFFVNLPYDFAQKSKKQLN